MNAGAHQAPMLEVPMVRGAHMVVDGFAQDPSNGQYSGSELCCPRANDARKEIGQIIQYD